MSRYRILGHCIALHSRSRLQGPDDLKVQSFPDPTPKNDEYLIAIHSSATNFFDLLQIRGKYQHQPPFPWIAGSEFSGVILKAPSSLPGGRTPLYKVGDKVFGASQGGYATHVACTEERLKPVPEGWSFDEAAGMFVTAPTSYAGLVTRANIKQGKTSCSAQSITADTRRRLGPGPRSCRRCRSRCRPDCQGFWCNCHRNCWHAA